MSSRLKYTCGEIFPSGCVIYTGKLPTFLPDDALACNANLDELLKQVFDKLEVVVEGHDFKDLNKGCYDFTPTTVTNNELHQQHITKVCEINTLLNTLKTTVDNLNIGTKAVTVDLKCLSPQAAPCAIGTNLYALSSVLNTLVTEICNIKPHLNL